MQETCRFGADFHCQEPCRARDFREFAGFLGPLGLFCPTPSEFELGVPMEPSGLAGLEPRSSAASRFHGRNPCCSGMDEPNGLQDRLPRLASAHPRDVLCDLSSPRCFAQSQKHVNRHLLGAFATT